jgi:hypothetical protein
MQLDPNSFVNFYLRIDQFHHTNLKHRVKRQGLQEVKTILKYIKRQLLNDMRTFQARSESLIILHILRKPNSIIVYYLFTR